jgi:hypothetical protein
MIQNELWKPIFINDVKTDYIISSNGQIYSLKTNKILKQEISNCGYCRVSLSYKIKKKTTNRKMSVHRLVALVFIDNPDHKPQVNHINGDKLDNCVENLEWVTPSENDYHAYMMGLKPYKYGSKSHLHKYLEKDVIKACDMMESGNYDINEISEKTGISTSMLYLIKIRHSWVDVSYKFEVENCKPLKNKYDSNQIEYVFRLLEEDQLSLYDISDITGVKVSTISNILLRRDGLDQFQYLYELYDISKYHKRKPVLNPLNDETREIIHMKMNAGMKKLDVVDYMYDTYKYNKDYIRHYINRNF